MKLQKNMAVIFTFIFIMLVISGCAQPDLKITSEPKTLTETDNSDAAISQKTTDVPPLPPNENIDAPQAASPNSSPVTYTGTVLAGTTAKYIAFNAPDYNTALRANKIILLYFYANWCPTCSEEQKQVTGFFYAQANPDIVGFRVNYKDSDTDRDEEALARQYGITYQHTKIIVKDAKQLKKSLESWDTARYEKEFAEI